MALERQAYLYLGIILGVQVTNVDMSVILFLTGNCVSEITLNSLYIC